MTHSQHTRSSMWARVAAKTAAVALLAISCTTSTVGAASDPVTLTITTWSAETVGWREWWAQTTEAFEADHPGVTVEIEQIAFADYVPSLTTRMVAGEAPELVHVPLPLTTLPAWADAGFLADLSDYIASTDVADNWSANQSAMQWRDGTYAVLLQDYGYVLFYNQALLDAAGVQVPTTPEELLAAAEATTSDDRYGYAITADNTVNFLRDAFMFVAGQGASWVGDDGWQLTDPAVVEALDVWRTLATDFAPQGTDINQKRQAFYDGNVAMMIEGPFILGQIPANSPEDVAPNLHVAQLPFANPPGDLSNALAISEGLDDDEQELAQELITYLTSPDVIEILAVEVTSPVARTASNEVLATSADLEEVVNAHTNQATLVFPTSEELRANFATFQELAVDELHRLLNSDDATEDVLADLQAKLEAEGITP